MRNQVLVPLLLLASLTGCATNTLRTAERLGSGEVAFGGGFDLVPLPTRAHANVTVGVGDVADVGLIGGVGLPSHIGASSRLYLGPVDLTVQAEHFWMTASSLSCTLLIIIPICGPDYEDVFALSGRLTSRLRELKEPGQSGYYAGLVGSASGLTSDRRPYGRRRNPFDSGALGVVGGLERRLSNGANFQTEVNITPICSGNACRGAFQISMGWNFGAHRPRVPREPRDRYRQPRHPPPTWTPRI